MEATRAARSLKAIAGALLAACAIALCAALPGQAWAATTVSSSDELKSAIENGETDISLNSGTYQMPNAKGKTLKISSTQGAIIEVVPGGQSEANGQLDYSLDGATVEFNGVTIKTNGQLYAGYARLSAVYNNCVIQNTYNLGVGTSEFNNCTFNITNEYLRVGGATTATFTGCTFNTDGRAILVFQDGTSVSQTVTVKDCTFNATAAANTWNGIHVAAVSVDGSQGGTYSVNLEGYNVVDTDFNGLWQIKSGEENITVIERGNQVHPFYVAQIGDVKYESIQAAVNAANDGDTITVIADHELTWDGETKVDGLPVFVAVDGKTVAIDLNGKKVTGASDASNNALYAAFAVDNDGNLTLKDSGVDGSVKITGTNAMYSLLMAYEDGANKATTLTVEGGSYYLEKASDSLIFCGDPDADDLVYIKGGSFKLGNLGVGENGKPWAFNVVGAGDHHVNVAGGTFNANVQRQHWANEVKVSETCYVQDNGDGTWTVKSGAGVYANEGILTGPFYETEWPVGYASLEAFIAAANADTEDTVDLNDPITLLKDAEVSGALVLGSGDDVKMDCNGYNVVLTDAAASLTAPEGLSVVTNVNDGKVVYGNGVYKVSIERKILEGEGGVWTVGSTEDLGFKCSGEFDLFAGVTVDGKAVDRANYEASAGSTVVTLKPAYLSTLSVGQHELVFKYSDDTSAAAKFEIKAASSNAGGEGGTVDPDKDDTADKTDSKSESKTDVLAKTGDAAGMAAVGAGIALAAAGAIALIARRRAA